MTMTLDRQWVDSHLALLQQSPPEKAREVLGVLLADTVAIASHARLGQVGGTRVDRAMVTPQVEGCAVWGADYRSTPADAAFLNGCAAEALDFQEVLINPRNNGHAAVVIVPALLALAEQRGIPGERLLRALWVAFAANIRLAEALGRGHRTGKAGFRTTSVVRLGGFSPAFRRADALSGRSRAQPVRAGVRAASRRGPQIPKARPDDGQHLPQPAARNRARRLSSADPARQPHAAAQAVAGLARAGAWAAVRSQPGSGR